MTESTAYDALVAELLADVLKLHDEVNTLKDFLPAQVEAAELRLAGIIALLQEAGNHYQEVVRSYTQSQGDSIRLQMEKDAKETKLRFAQDYNGVVNDALAKLATAAREAVRAELTAQTKHKAGVPRQNYWKIAASSLGSGVLAGLVVYGATALTHDLRQEAEADLGRAVVASWGKLDKKAKAIIDAERKI